MSTDLQVMEGTIDAEVLADLTVRREPSIVLEEARKAAVCLKDVLDKKKKKVMMNEEQYLEFEDWQTVGKFYGVTCCEEGDATYMEFGGAKGFKASSVALHAGKIISRATAFCMTDEEKWGERPKYAYAYCLKSGGTSVEDPGPGEIIWIPNPNKEGRSMPKKERVLVGNESVPLYQLGSMAQTRANSKVLRNVLAWVVVLAGYRPTPAEEMPGAAPMTQTVPPVDGAGKASPASGTQQARDESEEPPMGTDELLHEFLEKFDLVEYVKAWSDLKNDSLEYSWTPEQSKLLNDRSALALKRLKEAERKKK